MLIDVLLTCMNAYGQVVTMTAVSEDRDDPEWIAEMFPAFKESCDAEPSECLDMKNIVCTVLL